MGKPGYNNPTYLQAQALYRTGRYPCHFGCGRPGTTVDHSPPLSTTPTGGTWRGDLLPACKPCQDAQGGQLSHLPTRPRIW